MGRTVLELAGVTKSFGGVRALRGVSFDLKAGEVHALVGENGAGKSTLIRVITGAHAPDSGSIAVDGTVYDRLDPALGRRLGVAAIYQQPALFPDLTVAENIAIALEPPGSWRRVRWGERRRRAQELLDRVGASIAPDAEVRDLSMPEQQLVEIARSIGADAKILILDEPTASLTDREVDRLFRVVADMKARGVGLLYISHRLEELPRVADRLSALRDGAMVGTRRMDEVDRGALIRMMVGRDLASVFPKVEVEPGPVALRVAGLACRESGVHDVSFEVRRGEMLGLSGLIGSGRTEIARVLFGLTPADGGTIEVDGVPVEIRSPGDAIRAGIAYVPEDRRRYGVIPELSVAANSTLATLGNVSRLGWLEAGKERAVAEGVVGRFGVKAESVDTPVEHLSGGNQQKVALGRWVEAKPKVLILDEPTQGGGRGGEGGDPPDHGPARRGGGGDRHDLVGAARDFGDERPRGRGPRRDDRGDAGPGRRLGRGDPRPRAGPRSERGGGVMGRHRREWAILGALGVVLLILAVRAPGFFAPENLHATAVAAAPGAVAAMGMTLVILCRQIDISIGAQAGLCAVAAGLLARAGWPMPAVGVLTVAIGAGLGMVNGALVAFGKLPSIVATLATLVIGRESLRWWREGAFVSGLPQDFQWLGLGQSAGRTLILGAAGATVAVAAWGLRYLAIGRAVYAVGSDAEAARLAGLRPDRVVFGAFAALGAASGMYALLTAIQFPSVDPKIGTAGLELQTIAAVVVGGVAISGGRGSALGALLGVALLATIGPALIYLGVSASWGRAIEGGVILLAVASEGGARRKGAGR